MNDPLAAYRDALSLSPAGSPAGVLPNGVPVFTGVSAAGPGWTTVITPTGETIRREGTRAWRNNNPGNIEFGQFAQRYGAVGTDGRFAVFPTYEQGRAAKEALLFESPSYSGRTIASAINRYAPPVENNTNRYIEEVSRSIGVSADTPLSSLTPQQRQIMLDAMERVEGFRPGSSAPSAGGPSFVSAPPQSNMPEPSGRASTMNTAQPGMMPFAATEQQPFYRNPDFWDTLAIGLGGMSTRPNEAIIGAAQGRMQERRQDRRATEQRNQTLQWLASQGRDDLVAAVSAGLPITDAMNIALMPAPVPEQTSAMQNYQFLISQGIDPQAAIEQAFGGGGQTINVDTAGDVFNEAFAKSDVEVLTAVTNAGLAAQQNLVRIGQLETLLQSAPQGATGALIRVAGDLGIAGEFTDDVQAAQAIINQLVPMQRPPGSGQMSDRDVELFKQSVPRIINQPGGNALILSTMRKIAEYDAQGAQIVQQLRSGEIDRQTAMQMLLQRQNPLAATSGGISTTALPPANGGITLSQEALDAIERAADGRYSGN